MSAKLFNFWTDCVLTDVLFEFVDTTTEILVQMLVHKCILAVRCKEGRVVFAQRKDTETKNVRENLMFQFSPVLEESVIRQCFHFLYNAKVHSDIDYRALLTYKDVGLHPGIITLCEAEIFKRLYPTNILDILLFATKNDMYQLSDILTGIVLISPMLRTVGNWNKITEELPEFVQSILHSYTTDEEKRKENSESEQVEANTVTNIYID